MSRRKQAKPKPSKRSLFETSVCIGDEFDEEDGEGNHGQENFEERIRKYCSNEGIGDGSQNEQPVEPGEDGTCQNGCDSAITLQEDVALDEEDVERESNVSRSTNGERSTSGTPPTPSNGLKPQNDCGYCQASFGSFFLLKQHEQDFHSDLMPFKCKFCSKGFKHKRSHDRHEKSHSGIRKHKCNMCGQAFFRSDHLKLHLKTHEISKYSFVCVLCQRGFHSSSGLESHMQIHNKGMLPVTSKETDDDSIQQSPMDTSAVATSTCNFDQSQCTICSASFKTAEQLLRHMDFEHRILNARVDVSSSPTFLRSASSSQKPQPIEPTDDFYQSESTFLQQQLPNYDCGLCGEIFGDIGLLQKHTLHMHTLNDLDKDFGGQLPVVVNRRYRDASSLSPSMSSRAHPLSDPIYECQMCKRSFDSILALHGHCINAHGSLPECIATAAHQNDSTRPDDQNEENHLTALDGTVSISSSSGNVRLDDKQLYQCSQCDDVILSDLQSFTAHMRRHVTRASDDDSSKRRTPTKHPQYYCDLCGAVFANESSHDQHLIKHYLQKESEYSCKTCSKMYAVPDELQKHLFDVHALQMYKCSLCKEIFESRVDVQVHFAVRHSDEIVHYRCKSCNAAFASEDQFNVHLQVVHLQRSLRHRFNNNRHPSSGHGSLSDRNFQMDPVFAGYFPVATTSAAFLCPLCQDAFSVEYLYEKHLETVHRAQIDALAYNDLTVHHQPKSTRCKISSTSMSFLDTARTGNPASGALKNARYANNGNSLAHQNVPTASAPNATVIKCNICDRRCETMLELSQHKLQHCKVVHCQNCNFCHQRIDSIEQFNAHTRQHNAANGIPMSCIVCKQSLVSMVELQTHAKFHLALMSSPAAGAVETRLRHCIRCGKQFSTTVEPDMPCKASKEEPSMCRDCAKKETRTMDHQRSPGKCLNCNLKFETIEEQERHEKDVHRHGGVTSSTANANAKPYQCIKCQKSFGTEPEIQAHVATHVLQDGIHHHCMLCKKVFDSPSKLQCHLIEHSFAGCSEMQCYLCNAIFALPQPLQQHMLTKHGLDERPYECVFPTCEQKFFFRAELENHAFIHQQHSAQFANDFQAIDEPAFLSCPTCGLSKFSSLTAYQAHATVCSRPAIFTVHASPMALNLSVSNVSNVSSPSSTKKESQNDGTSSIHYCPHCPKRFNSLSALQGHSHVHMGSKSHQCSKCRKIFPTAAKLRNHQRQHNGEKPFPCNLCMRYFSRKDNLKVHMRTHYKQNGSAPPSPCAVGEILPTMVPFASHFLGSHEKSDNMNGGEQSSDDSATPFECSTTTFAEDDNSIVIDTRKMSMKKYHSDED